MKEYPRTEKILQIVTILAWLAIIAFMIEAGAILISYMVSCAHPEAAKNLYNGLNLYNLRQSDFWIYTRSVYFLVVALMIKCSVCYLIIHTISKTDLKNPSRI